MLFELSKIMRQMQANNLVEIMTLLGCDVGMNKQQALGYASLNAVHIFEHAESFRHHSQSDYLVSAPRR